MRTFILTSLALTAFAFNSILCRMALATIEIDPATFTSIRLASGALTLVILAALFSKTKSLRKSGQWSGAFFLFVYAVCFSFAYLWLATGTGALILFGSVQFTMVLLSLARGERPGGLEWLGFVCAFAGLIYLLLPGLEAPPILPGLLMAAAGTAWGAYTLLGRGSTDPLAHTMGNFVRAVPMAAVLFIVFLSTMHVSVWGILLAVLSGAVASGIGYTIWYAVLPSHTATRAALVQLPVPLITAVGGIIFLAEAASLRLGVASVLILGGIGVAIVGKRR